MALTSYADQEYYEKVSGVITTDDLEKRLYIASRHIDTLTFNRIVARGFENLTEFQKDVIRLVVCRQADFEAENESLINSVLSSYSINGVSIGINAGGWNVTVQDGVIMRADNYAMLEQTGLCCRRLGAI